MMTDASYCELQADCPLFGIRMHCSEITLRPLREGDLPHLAAIQPDDYEHDPRADVFPELDVSRHRTRLVYQDYWRSMGTWSPSSWSLGFVVEYEGSTVGVQSLEAENFLALGTVDSGSWLVRSVRGRGVGARMRMAVLSLAFDHLGARAAVSSARRDNAPSLAVSKRLGYLDNGVSLNASGSGVVELAHMRLTREDWQASRRSTRVDVVGLEACLPWFGLTPEVN